MVQTRWLPLSGLFAWAFLSFYSTGSTESFFKEKVVKSYQCPLKDLLLTLHIFFLKLNLIRSKWKIFLFSASKPSSQLPSHTCTKHLSCLQASNTCLYTPPTIPASPCYIGHLARRLNEGCKTAHVLSLYLSIWWGAGEGGFKNSTKTLLKIPKIFPLLSNWKLSTRFKLHRRCKKTLHSLTNVKEQHSPEIMFSVPNHHPKEYKTPQKDIRFTSSLFYLIFFLFRK